MHEHAINKGVKLVLFDLDGTLLDTAGDLFQAMNKVLDDNSLPKVTLDIFKSYLGHGVHELVKGCVGAHEDKIEIVTQQFVERYTSNMADRTKPFDGILEVLRQLKESGYILGIISNKNDRQVKILSKHYFNDYISFALGRTDDVERKPHRAMYDKFIKETNLIVESVIYVGDSEVDRTFAENFKATPIIVSWGYDKNVKADVKTAQELLGRINAR